MIRGSSPLNHGIKISGRHLTDDHIHHFMITIIHLFLEGLEYGVSNRRIHMIWYIYMHITVMTCSNMINSDTYIAIWKGSIEIMFQCGWNIS